jgi:thymidylate synthase ThyX
VTPREAAKERWLMARDVAICSVQKLTKLGLHKQVANRVLEPWFNIRVILSGTDFENFFALRAHPDAQPEFQELARQMLEAYNGSDPKVLKPGEWHIPFGDKMDTERLKREVHYDSMKCHDSLRDKALNEVAMKVSVARCARLSYHNYEGKDDYAADIKLCDRLFGATPRHLSPTEHVAQCLDSEERVGNFSGWLQYRHTFPDENLKDPRVKRKNGLDSAANLGNTTPTQ